MANAAAKKAAAARGAAASTYFPIVAGINLLYLFLRFLRYKSSLTFFHSSMAVILVCLSCFSYKGIIDDHANSAGSGVVAKGEALAGGLSLDLLGLAAIVQFGSLGSNYFYWLLGLIPIVGGHKLYKTFKGGSFGASDGFMPDSATMDGGSGNPSIDREKADSKKQKRAERRRQKWN